MNIYGKAMTDSKRQAHCKVVEMVKQQQIEGSGWPEQPGRCYWELMGVLGALTNPCNLLIWLVAGDGFETTTRLGLCVTYRKYIAENASVAVFAIAHCPGLPWILER